MNIQPTFIYPDFTTTGFLLIKFLKHNYFNTKAYNIKYKNHFLMYITESSLITQDEMIFSNYDTNKRTFESILQMKYKDLI